jgi:hypothetical protein
LVLSIYEGVRHWAGVLVCWVVPLYRKKGRASISGYRTQNLSDPRSALDQMKQCATPLSNPFLQICKCATLLEQLLGYLQRCQYCQRLSAVRVCFCSSFMRLST